MPKIIVTSRYIKPNSHKRFGNYIKYIATLEGETSKANSDKVLIQSGDKDYTLSEITKKCKDAYRGGTRNQVKSIKVYVKAEKNQLKAYYVVNDSVDGSVDL